MTNAGIQWSFLIKTCRGKPYPSGVAREGCPEGIKFKKRAGHQQDWVSIARGTEFQKKEQCVQRLGQEPAWVILKVLAGECYPDALLVLLFSLFLFLCWTLKDSILLLGALR